MSYRATEAAKHGYYELIEEMFTMSSEFSLDSVRRHNVSQVTLEDLCVKLGHTKQDFVVKYVFTCYQIP